MNARFFSMSRPAKMKLTGVADRGQRNDRWTFLDNIEGEAGKWCARSPKIAPHDSRPKQSTGQSLGWNQKDARIKVAHMSGEHLVGYHRTVLGASLAPRPAQVSSDQEPVCADREHPGFAGSPCRRGADDRPPQCGDRSGACRGWVCGC